mmetsp:Transcript_19501/g.17699  ORF Transcript_19501/g.17699 Transcript_19501/m.17699 type:complete len:82 (-) Transcript_19501:29-274(-)
MSSGHGLYLSKSRCYDSFKDLAICTKEAKLNGSTDRLQCKPLVVDYFECLHHTKELKLLNEHAAAANVEPTSWFCLWDRNK